jgi:transcriptional regulator with XRE-family HTH domain
MPLKPPNPVDIHVGKRIRMRRIERQMSRATLGGFLGLTHQQIEKYERGVNRVGASRIQEICNVLEISPSFLFEDAPGAISPNTTALPHYLMDVLATADGVRFVEALGRVKDPDMRQALARLITVIAKNQPADVLQLPERRPVKPESNNDGDN